MYSEHPLLHTAAEFDDLEMVAYLLDQFAINLEARNSLGQTALIIGTAT
jgi:ankyrin repeat protein